MADITINFDNLIDNIIFAFEIEMGTIETCRIKGRLREILHQQLWTHSTDKHGAAHSMMRKGKSCAAFCENFLGMINS